MSPDSRKRVYILLAIICLVSVSFVVKKRIAGVGERVAAISDQPVEEITPLGDMENFKEAEPEEEGFEAMLLVMKKEFSEDVEVLAELYGIETAFHDAFGKRERTEAMIKKAQAEGSDVTALNQTRSDAERAEKLARSDLDFLRFQLNREDALDVPSTREPEPEVERVVQAIDKTRKTLRSISAGVRPGMLKWPPESLDKSKVKAE